MILATRGGGSVEVRDANASAFVSPVPRAGLAGDVRGDVVGLPVVLAAGRLISEAVAGMGLCVYETSGGESRKESTDSWQARLFEQPNEIMSPFQLVRHWAWSLMFAGNSVSLKVKSAGEVVELWPWNPADVTIRRAGNGLVYDLRDGSGKVARVDRSQVLHIPGLTTGDPLVGRSLIDLAGPSLRKHLYAETYHRRFYENDATPGGLLTTAGSLSREQRTELRESWQSRHQGSGNAGKLAVLDKGATYQSIGMSPRDSQFVEMAKFSVQEIARIFGVPAGFLGDPEAPPARDMESESRRFLTFGLAPWVNMIEQGLVADRDLFPAGANLEPEFDVDDIARSDIKARYEAYLIARQGGWLNINEIREEEDLAPIDGGEDYQATPVGGAPNLQAGGMTNGAA